MRWSKSPTAFAQQGQVSINVPIINDEIFNPVNIDFDYGDANNNIYTLNVKENPTEVPSTQAKLTSNDLLPTQNDKKWFENPDVGIKIEDANLLSDAVQKVGVDTVGQTRKNPTYDLRGTVPCPKFQISRAILGFFVEVDHSTEFRSPLVRSSDRPNQGLIKNIFY